MNKVQLMPKNYNIWIKYRNKTDILMTITDYQKTQEVRKIDISENQMKKIMK